MTCSEQKRPLPPTPRNVNSNELVDSSENEKKLLKLLEKKDATISNLKAIIIEWKKKALDAEEAYKTLEQQTKEKEQFLIKQHEAEIEALAKTHSTETNENLELLVRLEKENKALQQGHDDEFMSNPISTSYSGQLCDTAEFANQMVMDTIHTDKQDSVELIQRINDMVMAMEDTLHDFQHIQDELTVNKQSDWNPPQLVSDSSSDESYDDMDEDVVLELPTTPTKKKKTSLRTNSISNFLFKHTKKPEERLSHTTTTTTTTTTTKRPSRTLSLSSQCS